MEKFPDHNSFRPSSAQKCPNWCLLDNQHQEREFLPTYDFERSSIVLSSIQFQQSRNSIKDFLRYRREASKIKKQKHSQACIKQAYIVCTPSRVGRFGYN